MSPAEHHPALHLARTIAAPRDRVYAMWTDLGRAREWWGPEGCVTEKLTCDARVGGEFRWTLRTPDGERMTAQGEYREVRPGERLAYTWQWADDPDWEAVDSLVTVEFHATGSGTTELRLTHDGFPSQISRGNHAGGWSSVLDRFVRLFADSTGA